MYSLTRSLLFVSTGLVVGFLFGFSAHGGSAAPGARPVDGWLQHGDVDRHFPDHPALFAHHWCKKITARLSECQLYDSDAPNAKLIGIEPIVSDATFRTFTHKEQRLWHWHKTSRSRIVIPGGTRQEIAQANQRRGTTHGKTVLLWDPWDTLDPLGLPRVIPH